MADPSSGSPSPAPSTNAVAGPPPPSAEATHEDYLAFNPKQPMHLYEEDTVTVAAGRSLDLVASAATSPNLPPPQVERFPHSGHLVSAELTGDGFQIEPTSKSLIQDIDNPNEPGVWLWMVTPQKPGTHDLVLSICFHSMQDGIDVSNCNPSQQRQIQVVVAGLLPAMKYAAAEYTLASTLLPAGMVGSAATWIWSRTRKRKRAKAARSQPLPLPPVD